MLLVYFTCFAQQTSINQSIIKYKQKNKKTKNKNS